MAGIVPDHCGVGGTLMSKIKTLESISDSIFCLPYIFYIIHIYYTFGPIDIYKRGQITHSVLYQAHWQTYVSELQLTTSTQLEKVHTSFKTPMTQKNPFWITILNHNIYLFIHFIYCTNYIPGNKCDCCSGMYHSSWYYSFCYIHFYDSWLGNFAAVFAGYGLLPAVDWGIESPGILVLISISLREGFTIKNMKSSISKSLVTLDLPRLEQCLEMISLKLGLALLYVVINIMGVSA